MGKANFTYKKMSDNVLRRDYTKITREFDAPNLLEVQKQSFKRFIEKDLEELIGSFFPITSIGRKYTLAFNGISFDEPKRSESECRDEGKTYGKSLYVDLALINNETGVVKESKKVAKKKTSSQNNINGIFFCDIPIMTEKGTFIVNGIETIVLSQILRSPGPYMFSKTQIKLSNSRKRTIEGNICEVLPSKGILFTIYIPKGKENIQVMFRNATSDSTVSISIITFFRALGMTSNEIRKVFNNNKLIENSFSKCENNFDELWKSSEFENIKKSININETSNSDKKNKNIDSKLKSIITDIMIIENKLEKGEGNKEELLKQKEVLESKLETERAAKYIIEELSISTRAHDSKLRVSDDDTICYQSLIYKYFFDNKTYDLSLAGRYKMTRKLRLSERLYHQILAEDLTDLSGKIVLQKGTVIQKDELDLIKKLTIENKLNVSREINIENKIKHKDFVYNSKVETISIYADSEKRDEIIPIIGVDTKLDSLALTMSDLLSMTSYVINLQHEIGAFDDVDHLGNKRIKLIHELLKQKVNVGLARLEKFISEKLANADGANNSEEQKEKEVTIKSIINAKPIQIAIKDFFNSHQLIQFIDQQNPLSELTNKRRISAMGPGGISREDPNLDIRDVHYSQYGKICPIETPEGMNIGLIMSLATLAKIDEKGFLISPYWKVKNGVITDEIEWLTALREDEYVIACSNKNVVNNKFTEDKVLCRFRSTLEFIDAKDIDYVDVSPKQVVSIAASCIPFLENNDANRALMGANMQRQATPLIRPFAPIVGTGNEFKIAHDSGMAVVYNEDTIGTVKYVDGQKVIVENSKGQKEYILNKYLKSNQNTCNNQSPIVSVGDKIRKGQMIADGPAMQNGELSLGQNMLVGFTTWSGYNYEDAIILSSRLVSEDIYTSIHISEYTINCVRTKNGDEEITRDLPNVSSASKRFLDEDGIIMVGAEVKEGDVLVGKISPKGIVDLTSEEKLLLAIFGEKTKNVKETSLKVPHGGEGTIAAVKRFRTQDGYQLDDDVIEQIKVYIAQKRKIQIGDKMAGRHGNKGIISKIVPIEDMPHLEDGTPLDIMLNPLGVPSRMNIGQILEIHLGYAMRHITLHKLLELVIDNAPNSEFRQWFGINETISKSIKKAINSILKEKKITTLKEAISQFTDLDYTIALSKAGVSREQIVAKVSTPVFEGVERNELEDIMREAGICPLTSKDGKGKDGKFKLIDGRTGEYLDGNISVGIMYMLKLDHMVDDKIHARSVGSYSKITQQPLGGKSQNGGQRFGEMEVWALEAYGAAHNLRELLTIKSDDVKGRNNTYNAIIKGKPLPPHGLPESFKLLTKQLQGLGLQVEITMENNEVQDIDKYISDSSNTADETLEEENLIDIGNNFIKDSEF